MVYLSNIKVNGTTYTLKDAEARELIESLQNSLSNYYTKDNTYSKTEIDNKVSAIPKFAIEVVTTLPTADISTATVYLLKSGDDDQNLYTEYIYVNSAWEELGTQTLDLSGYATSNEVSTLRTQVNANTSKAHTHDNKTTLDGITATKVGHWDAAYNNNHSHTNKTVLDGITSATVSAWDGKVSASVDGETLVLE